jgi:hypothetical protein
MADQLVFKDEGSELASIASANAQKMYYEKSKLMSNFNAESGVQSLCQK